jgi:methionyl-tRNA formyltransferase
MTPLKIIFAGTPDFAVPCLQALIDSPHHIQAVLTQPDRPKGRGLKLTSSPIKNLALKYSLPIEQPETLRNPIILEKLSQYQPDVIIVVAYGLIVPENILTLPHFGCINVHASLLPQWRGAAPIQRAILAGDSESGITIMQMAKGLDTGDILLQEKCTILARDTAQDLHDRLAALGAEQLLFCLDLLTKKNLNPVQQDDHLATYANKITKQEAEINWQLSADEIDRQIRAFNPWPVAYTYLNNENLRIWQAIPIIQNHAQPAGKILQQTEEGIDVACGKNSLRLLRLQFPGGKVLSAKEVVSSKKIKDETILPSPAALRASTSPASGRGEKSGGRGQGEGSN